MERETKEIILPSGIIVKIKTYLTGKEKRDITNASIPTSVDYDNQDGVKGMNPVAMVNNGEDMALKTVIVSINNETPTDTVDQILSLKSTDSDCILKAVKEVVDGLTEKKN